MILTGRAKEDFLQYYWNNYPGKVKFICKEKDTELMFNSLYPIMKNALIIEWLDSVKLTITIQFCIDRTFDSYLDLNETNEIQCCQFGINREEATKQAIIKANEIYNNLNK